MNPWWGKKRSATVFEVVALVSPGSRPSCNGVPVRPAQQADRGPGIYPEPRFVR
jgi:hypothetical protein